MSPKAGMLTISPAMPGDLPTPATRLRVPAGANIDVSPQGEGALYTPVPLQLGVVLVDHASGRSALGAASSPFAEWGNPGDWHYDVTTMTIAAPVPGGITTSDLVAIRLPGLLRQALRPLVTVLADDGSFTIGGGDPDERAVAAYVTAQLVRDNPTQAVAAELGINANAAGQRVFRLRKAGRLPASKRGKKPCPDGPSLSASFPPAAGNPDRPGRTRPPSTPTKRPKRGASSS